MSRLIAGLTLGPLIGSGHFGRVYHGVDPVHGPVAVKVMSQAVGEPPLVWASRKQALLAEGRHLSAAKHQNVVGVHQALEGENGDTFMIVMEYCDGGSLQSAFENGPLSLARVRDIGMQICHGLHALHARGMLHRDVKPANVMVRKGISRLGDFGLVTDDIILGYAAQVGYNDHLPPEVHNGSGTSIRSDIWAVGMTLYRLMHGAEWYGRSPSPRTMIANGGFSQGLKWLPHVPDRWRRILRKMLHDDPHQRCQTAMEVQTALSTAPVAPDWMCEVAPGQIKWTRANGARRHEVVWRQGPKHEWVARSLPVGAGNRRALGGSSDLLPKVCERQLREFFTAQT